MSFDPRLGLPRSMADLEKVGEESILSVDYIYLNRAGARSDGGPAPAFTAQVFDIPLGDDGNYKDGWSYEQGEEEDRIKAPKTEDSEAHDITIRKEWTMRRISRGVRPIYRQIGGANGGAVMPQRSTQVN